MLASRIQAFLEGAVQERELPTPRACQEGHGEHLQVEWILRQVLAIDAPSGGVRRLLWHILLDVDAACVLATSRSPALFRRGE